ncbi:hypothetical protein XOCgx_3183 [Xanthomonas oryzae pv. oryzicola]|nr:hypothetical protein XOCgx_3183 [Xanthomonas oryzae pv. oryzicola]
MDAVWGFFRGDSIKAALAGFLLSLNFGSCDKGTLGNL